MDESPKPSSASFVPEQDLRKSSNLTSQSPRASVGSPTTTNPSSPTTKQQQQQNKAPPPPASTTSAKSGSPRASSTTANNNNNNNDDDKNSSTNDNSSSNHHRQGNLDHLGFDDAADTADNDCVGPLEFTNEKYLAMIKNLKVGHWHETRHQLKTIRNVQSGEELTQWFRTNGYAGSPEDAVKLGNFLINQKVLYPMLRRLAPKGFANTDELFYMLTPERQEKNLVANAFSKVRDRVIKSSAGIVTPFLPGNDTVKYNPVGFDVEAIVYEYERYSGTMADGLEFSKDNLQTEKLGDPPHFSIDPEEVPVPSVGGASPDLCEWIDEWVPKVTEGKTSSEGWVYGDTFGNIENNFSAVFNRHEHRVRARGWSRTARKIPDINEITVEEEVQQTQKEIEDKAHKEMLLRIEKARQAKQKFYFQWTVDTVQLKQELAPNSIFLVVEHFATRQRSQLSAQRPSADPGFIDFPLADCTGQFEVSPTQIVGFAVWANLSLGRKQQLGYASFLVPEKNPDDEIELTDVIVEVTDKENTNIGCVKFEYGMAAVPLGDDDVASADGDEGSHRTSAILHSRHCALELSIVQIEKVDHRIIDRSRGSRWRCLAFLAPKGEPQAFIRIKYRGLVSNMTLESKRVVLTETAKFDFSTVLALRHLVPVTIELWYEKGSPGDLTQELMGDVKLEFVRSGLETVTNEKPVFAAPDVAKKIYEQQMNALPPESKPRAPPPPENPKLEELLNQVRKSQQQRASLAGGEKKKGEGEATTTTPTADTEKSPLNNNKNLNNDDDASPKKQDENLYGTIADDLNDIMKQSGVEAPLSPAQAEIKEKEKQGLIPTLMTKACNMSIRYKYLVEGEAQDSALAASELQELADQVIHSKRTSRRNSGDLLADDGKNKSKPKPNAAPAAPAAVSK